MTETARTGMIKICGLREPEHAVAAVEAGADLLGFIFAPARRQVSPEQARICIEAAKRAATHPVRAVGVFVNADADELQRTADIAGLDVLQLQGEEPPDLLDVLTLPVIKAFRPLPGAKAEEVLASTSRFSFHNPAPDLYLIDGYHPDHHGGEGRQADWAVAAEVAELIALTLAGGLDASNVGEAIRTVRPRAVDVSSGVETDGVKDPEKIRAFVAAAREAFASI